MKNRKLQLYLFFIIICLGIVGFRLTRTTEIIETVSYGLTTDSSVRMDPGTVIATEFTMTGSQFKGISVKFQSDDTFDRESIHARMIDAETEEFLAECSISLKNERIQNNDGGSFIFFPFEIKEAEEKKVRIEFELTGEETDTIPSLVVSRNKTADSLLYVNNEQSDYSLVSYARYSAGEERNTINKIISGILWLLIGYLIYFWSTTKEQEKIHGEKTTINTKRQVSEIFGRFLSNCSRFINHHIHFFALCGIIILTLIVILHGYMHPVKFLAAAEGNHFLKIMYLGISAVILLSLLVLYWLNFIRKTNIEMLFAVTAVIAGMLFCCVITVDSVPDEPSHIDTAYSLSNELMGIGSPERSGYIYKRACDVDAYAEEKQNITVDSYRRLVKELFEKPEDTSLVETGARSNLSNAGRLYYLPQALGISLGRLIGAGFMMTIMLGRLFSLGTYILIVCLALRKLPFAKVSLMIIACLPISLQQAASISYDGMINAVAFLYSAFCLALIYGDRKAGGKEFAVILISGFLMATVKGGVYVLFSFLPLLALKNQNYHAKKEKGILIASAGVFLFAFAEKHLVRSITRLSAVQGSAVGGAASSEIFTLSYFLHDPMHFFSIFVNTFYKQADSLVRNMVGGNLGWREINLKWYVIFALILILLLSCLNSEKKKRIAKMDRIYLIVLACGMFLLVILSMLFVWTPVTSDYIRGVQGRYFIPFLLLVLLSMRGQTITLQKNIDRQLIYSIACLDFLAVIQVILVVCNK